jgi:hypothetical protein
MSSFKAGQWIIILVLYAFVFFLILWSYTNARIAVYTPDQCVGLEDPGFTNFSTTYLQYGGVCLEPSDLSWSVFSTDNGTHIYLRCTQFDSETCEAFSNCQWTNRTILSDYCGSEFTLDQDYLFQKHLVNLSYYGFSSYNITGNATENMFYTNGSRCEQGNLNSQVLCEEFGCNWVNTSEYTKIKNDEAAKSGFLKTVSFAFGFDNNICGASLSFIFRFLFVYLPFVLLLYAIYMIFRGGL